MTPIKKYSGMNYGLNKTKKPKEEKTHIYCYAWIQLQSVAKEVPPFINNMADTSRQHIQVDNISKKY